MEQRKADLIIIGGGLTGLAIAYLLRQTDLNICILEARDRLGGRILTTRHPDRAPVEMGATWLGKKHRQLVDLLQKLDIETFEQQLGKRAIYEPISTSPPQLVNLPPNHDPSFRIRGGTSSLIEALAQSLPPHSIHYQQIVRYIRKTADKVVVTTETDQFEAPLIVSTLPPYLLTHAIQIQPVLPDSLLEVARQTHTWMGESIKVSLTYAQPFWRSTDSSGTIFSNVGPIPEMYDHSDYEDQYYALKGFFNGSYYPLSQAERLELVLKQLDKYFPDGIARNYLNYEETVWRNELFTYQPYDTHLLPHQNNGHSIFRQAFLDDRLLIAGSETAEQFPGYMEGAIRSAQWASQWIQHRRIKQ